MKSFDSELVVLETLARFCCYADDSVLDDLVDNIKREEADQINEGGFDSQLRFLLKKLGPKRAVSSIVEAVRAGADDEQSIVDVLPDPDEGV